MARRPDIKELYKIVRRLIIAIIGFTVLVIGVVMIATPGPSILVIPLGLGILATEFVWARRLLNKIKVPLKEKTFHTVHRFKQRYL
jgi:uncharacterized protein (TIGR02611 family)